MVVNKVVYNKNTLIDLTTDTVTPATLQNGIKAHDKSGAVITGTNTNDVTSTDATAVAGDILASKTAYSKGAKLTGSMTNRGAVNTAITTKAQSVTIAAGYHNGSGKVTIATAEQNKIIAANIKKDVTILGVAGELEGSTPMYGNGPGQISTFELFTHGFNPYYRK